MKQMRRYLYMGVFFAGLVTLAAELSASRLLGNYYGTSNLVWASIIGLILIYLTTGYTLGGRWADKSPHLRTFFLILAWAALLTGVIPLAARPILRLSSQAFDQMQIGTLLGAFISVLLLFSAPIILLGTASPFAIRLAVEDKEHSGRVSGKIYAISTLGSFIGTFLPSLIMIPLVGTYRTFAILGAMLLFIAMFGIWKTNGTSALLKILWMPVILALATLIGLKGNDKIALGLVFEDESQYNYIQVQHVNRYYLLRLNEGQGIHSIYHPDIDTYYGPWELILVAPFFNPAPYDIKSVERIAILGLAAGTSARQVNIVYPHAIIDGYEIDAKIIDVGYEYFDLDFPNLNIFIEDARRGLSKSTHTYQIISIDVFRPPYIPWHLTTKEFFREVKNHLTDDGVMLINIARIQDYRKLVDALAATIRSEFPCVYSCDIPGTFNTILFASKQSTEITNLFANYSNLKSNPQTPKTLLQAIELTTECIQTAPYEGIVLTDDRAPVEWLINTMIIDFFVSGKIEALQ